MFLPLADPVISAIFASVEVAGLAAKSLVRVILSDGGANIGNSIGEVLSVTPQRIHSKRGERGCRVDVEIVTDGNADVVQPVKMMYEKPPYEVAMPQFEMYNVQLARFREVESDWDNELRLWLYALNAAQVEKKSLSEVVAMTPQ